MPGTATREATALEQDYDLSQEQINQYQKNGHILLRDVVPEDSLPSFRNSVVKAHEGLMTDEDKQQPVTRYDKAFRITENLWESDDIVRAHVLSKRYAGIAARLLGCRDVRIYHDLTFFKESTKNHGSDTPWHQDGHYWPLEDAPCLTLWVPLIDCPASMGPMSFVSGTHKSRAAEHLEITDESDRLIKNLIRRNELTVAPAVDMKAGDATFHSCWTFHAAGPNASDRRREAFAIAYYDADAILPNHPPINKRRAANIAKWFPGVRPGQLAASYRNPAVLGLGTVQKSQMHILSMRPWISSTMMYGFCLMVCSFVLLRFM